MIVSLPGCPVHPEMQGVCVYDIPGIGEVQDFIMVLTPFCKVEPEMQVCKVNETPVIGDSQGIMMVLLPTLE